jgi:glycosidase
VRWVNNKAFDGGQSTEKERELRDFYKRLLNFTIESSALMGNYQDLQHFNQANTEWYNDKVLSFARWSKDEQLIIISNFSESETYGFELQIPADLMDKLMLVPGEYQLKEQLYGSYETKLVVNESNAAARIDIQPLESLVLRISE